MGRGISGILVGLVILTVALGIHVIRETASITRTDKKAKPVHITLTDEQAVAERLASILAYNTVSSLAADQHLVTPNEIIKMHEQMQRNWPMSFKTLSLRKIDKYSLLFKWQGTDNEKLPALFISHQDVVAAGDEKLWTHPPFGGVIADGFVWGRGALDVKVTMAALLEAVEHLIQKGFKPRRTIYLAFGHDEEVGGHFGAGRISQELQHEVQKLEFVMDEGGTILSDGLGGITPVPVALVGIAEKITRNYVLEINGTGGHTMTPPSLKKSAVSRLAKVIAKLDKMQPAPRLATPSIKLLKALAPGAKSMVLKYALTQADNWFWRWVLANALNNLSDELRAMVQTTRVINDISTSPPGKNIVPAHVSANINCRILPGTSESELFSQLEQAAQKASDGSCTLRTVGKVLGSSSDIGSTENIGFKSIQQAAQETLKSPEGLLIAPYLMLGRTDSLHYTSLTPNIYRFMPFHMNKTAGDVQRVHGIDERVGTKDYAQGVKFYIQMLQLSTS